ncbi:hypothetical protein EUTSA_v10022942mg [Eutrema salsugineum]|uniref:Knottin scorpion toxin-like domain-containing protein n=1 Tax=Eutrema salsugineum TaxID=72664 RepID=V4NVJ3_EUTSA|nr:hypothetical protein EUTSA_v10022942mg [Eutrema salsugineum]
MAITLKHLVVFVFICFFVISDVHSHTKTALSPGDERDQKVFCSAKKKCERGERGRDECNRYCYENWYCPGFCIIATCCCNF